MPGREHDSRLSILLIEDHPDIASGLKTLLELVGFAVEVAGTGERGVQRLLESLPAAALIDLGLPDIDGLEVARRVRSQPGGCGVPLIALTAHTRLDDRLRAKAAGFDAYVNKPADADRIIAVVKEVLARSPAGSTPASPAPAPV